MNSTFSSSTIFMIIAWPNDSSFEYCDQIGLPPSPPVAPSTVSIIPSKPYPGHGNNGRTIQPLGVDVSRKHHKHGMNKSILAIIILSCFVAAILVCASAWVFLFRARQSASRPDPTPATTLRSLAKSSGTSSSESCLLKF